jgi:hypothetical protein
MNMEANLTVTFDAEKREFVDESSVKLFKPITEIIIKDY